MKVLRNVLLGAGVVTAIFTVAGAIADIASLFELKLDVIFMAAGAAIGLVSFAFVVEVIRAGGHLQWGIIAIVFGAVSAGLIGAGFRHNFFGSTAIADESRAATSGLALRAPPNIPVLECAVYQGDGRIPEDGYQLVIFDRPVEISGQGTDGYYMTRKPAQNNDSGTGWHTPLLDTGSKRTEIAAVLMPNDLFQTLLSIMPNATEAPDAWKTSTLPPGVRLRPLIVEPQLRTATDPSGCPK